MNVPSWYVSVLLALAAFRTYRLIAEDTILNRLRNWIVGLPRDWHEGDAIPERYREELAIFITCPWCAGFWITVAWWGTWLVFPHAATVAAVPWALSALVALAAKNLDE